MPDLQPAVHIAVGQLLRLLQRTAGCTSTAAPVSHVLTRLMELAGTCSAMLIVVRWMLAAH